MKIDIHVDFVRKFGIHVTILRKDHIAKILRQVSSIDLTNEIISRDLHLDDAYVKAAAADSEGR